MCIEHKSVAELGAEYHGHRYGEEAPYRAREWAKTLTQQGWYDAAAIWIEIADLLETSKHA